MQPERFEQPERIDRSFKAGIQFFEKANIRDLPREQISNLSMSEIEFLSRLVGDSDKSWADNGKVEMGILMVRGKAIPVTVNHGAAGNCHLISPTSHYIRYGSFEASRNISPLFRPLIRFFSENLSRILRSNNFDKAVHVNNWFLATNPEVELALEQILEFTSFLKEKYPGHAIIFRNLEVVDDACPLLTALEGAGYSRIYNRTVFHWDGKRQEVHRRTDYKNDVKLLQETNLTFTFLNNDESQWKHLQDLYQQLYIARYTHFNPRYKSDFFRHLHESGFVRFVLIGKGKFLGFCSYYMHANRMTATMCGFETKLNTELGLYRLLQAALMKTSLEEGVLLNLSAGVGRFKSNRGAIAVDEFEAVYTRHLSFPRRLSWAIGRTFYNRFARVLSSRMEI